eukprot:gene8671-11714_t
MRVHNISGSNKSSENEDDTDDLFLSSSGLQYSVSALRKNSFTSDAMKKLLIYVPSVGNDDLVHSIYSPRTPRENDETFSSSSSSSEINHSYEYTSSLVFPNSILSRPEWKCSKGLTISSSNMSDIFKLPHNQRTADQVSVAVKWLISVWKIAADLGVKICGAMLQAFRYEYFEAGQSIITEGEIGSTMYIIISGITSVHKNGIGVVAQLANGKSFGEVALTQGNDLRTATIIATVATHVLKLAKEDFDYFVRNMHDIERKESQQALKLCPLFLKWNRKKISKLLTSCSRKTCEKDEIIFNQGDPPDNLYVLVDGSVEIYKTVVFIGKNSWPTDGKNKIVRSVQKQKPVSLRTLTKQGDYFGEVSILNNSARTTTAKALTRSILIVVDKLEFLHLIDSKFDVENGLPVVENTMKTAADLSYNYLGDEDLLEVIPNTPAGGPLSFIRVGSITLKYPPQPNSQLNQKLKAKLEAKNAIPLVNHQLCNDGKLLRSVVRRGSDHTGTSTVTTTRYGFLATLKNSNGSDATNTNEHNRQENFPTTLENCMKQQINISRPSQSSYGRKFRNSLTEIENRSKVTNASKYGPHFSTLENATLATSLSNYYDDNNYNNNNNNNKSNNIRLLYKSKLSYRDVMNG